MALVSTPDVAKDLFKGLWDQTEDKELFQAYSNLDSFSTSDSYIPASTCSQEATKGYRTRSSISGLRRPVAPLPLSPLTFSKKRTLITPTTPSTATTTPTPTSVTSSTKKRKNLPAVTLEKLKSTSPTQQRDKKSPISVDSSTSATTAEAASSPTSMNHPYYPSHIGGSPGSNAIANRYTQLALLLVSQSQNQLSREEEEKRRVRRERNKVAATKCREKRKAHSVYVRHEYSQVSDTTKRLEEQISSLKRERDELIRVLESHQCHLRQGEPPQHHHHQHHHQQHQQQHLPHTSLPQQQQPVLPDMFIKPEPHF